MLLLNVLLRLWWQPKESGTFPLPPNPAAQGLPLQPSQASFSPANQCLPGAGRKLPGCTGARVLPAKVPCFWLFLELICSPNLPPALARGLELGAGVGQGACWLPSPAGQKETQPSAGQEHVQLCFPALAFLTAPCLSQHCAGSTEKRIFFFGEGNKGVK